MDNEAKIRQSWWEMHRPTKRRIIQLYSALLYNAHLRGFVRGEIFTGNSKAVCVPGFNCYSCPGAVGACPLGSIQNALGSLNKHIGFYVLGIILLYGMLLGRTICGWLCPLGLIQELLHKIPTPKIKKSRITRGLTYLKYVILVIFVMIIPIYYGILQGIPVPGFCKYICPAGTFEGAMGMLPKNPAWFSMLGPIFTRKFVIMVLVGLACIFCYRAFCRFLCPLGAIYGMFNRLAIIGVKLDTGLCNNCGACVRNCKMDVKQVGDHECIHCAKCVAVCRQGALSFKAGGKTLIHPEGKGAESEAGKEAGKSLWIICSVIAVILLAGVIIWTNFMDPTVKAEAAESEEEYYDEESWDPESEGLEAYEDEYGNIYYFDEDGNAYYKDDDGIVYYVTDDGEYIEISSGYDTESTGADTEGGESYAEESDAPVGYEVGNKLQDFDTACLDGSSFSLADCRGKVVFINLWATYCGPCVKELPHFVDLYHEHGDDIAVLAVHANMTTEDVNEYLQDKGWDIQFAIDDDNESIFKIVNGSLALPQTIVLNRKGEVVYNKVGSVTEEMLQQLYDEAAAQ
ncbi:MAG: redoxin family protein [Lachnospiraceae bacterium]|nr:redoxin family protein [Lachnospiraceae bacterium]